LNGPYVTGIDYPAVLVARAHSGGSDLDLVLYPGHKAGTYSLTVERLAPGRRYDVSGALTQELVADDRGVAALWVRVDGRTPVKVVPAAC
jgi:hypothetical protein